MPHRQLVLLSALAIAGCTPAEDSAPPPGAVANFLERSEGRAASEKAVAVRDADARAAARADRAAEGIARTEREGRGAD